MMEHQGFRSKHPSTHNDLFMNKQSILFIWTVKDWLKNYLQEQLQDLEQIELIFPPDKEAETLLALSPKADIMVGWQPTEAMLEAAQNLKVFINPGTGVQHHVKRFGIYKTRNIALLNGHGHAHLSAQHAVATLLTLTNKIIPHHDWMKAGKWRTGDKDASSLPMRGRKIGLCGYGAINQYVHRFLSGFGVEFAAFRRDWSKYTDTDYPTDLQQFEASQLHDFLTYIDTLMIALPLTSQTKGIIGKTELELLGKEGLVVNVGRGPLIDEESLYKALDNKTISGAAIDTWYNYQPDADEQGLKYPYAYPFHELDNIILSPHRAGSPNFDMSRWQELASIIRAYVTEGRLMNLVDLEAEY